MENGVNLYVCMSFADNLKEIYAPASLKGATQIKLKLCLKEVLCL